ncbi:MAG: cation:proton antiporter subunit C [Sphaerochaetaceae bacterium]|jgi:multicomponent Na+:H+ antiporter subunit C|nr:cation:proton antiporter subunit C [Sphaerochaetaceae bacterium]MDD3942297.1 cation:proton antiporter subunit C [Sphaerochaetaceae bacterium]MDX9940469.1 cation:proton antiporter subunit C [Sphaerochaetaceae bacterium]
MIERILLLVLFMIGFWAIMAHRNIIKKIFGLNIINASVVILFILEGSRIGNEVPIMYGGIGLTADPIPQALMLTAIVIGVCVTALSLALAVHLYRTSGSFDIDVIKRRIQDEA